MKNRGPVVRPSSAPGSRARQNPFNNRKDAPSKDVLTRAKPRPAKLAGDSPSSASSPQLGVAGAVFPEVKSPDAADRAAGAFAPRPLASVVDVAEAPVTQTASRASNGDASGGGGDHGRGVETTTRSGQEERKVGITAEAVINHRLSLSTTDVAGSLGTATPPEEARDSDIGGGNAAAGHASRDALFGDDVDADELAKRRQKKPARSSSAPSLQHSRSYIAPEDRHLPKTNKSWQASVKLALEGASVEYYEAAAQLFEGAENEEQEEVILKRASKSPRFTEALIRQGLEVEELGPRSNLPVDRRAALLAAVMQERDSLAGEDFELTTAERMSRILRGRVQEVLGKSQRRETKRRQVLRNASMIEEASRFEQIAYLNGKIQRSNMALDRRDQERAKDKERLSSYFQYVQDVATWAREDEYRQMQEKDRQQQEKAERRRLHQRSQQKQQDQRMQQRRQQKAAKEHQAARFARMRDHQSRLTDSRQSYDQSVYQEQCRPMLEALKSMTDPRGIASYIKWLEAQDQAHHAPPRRTASSSSVVWSRDDPDVYLDGGDQTVWRGHLEFNGESADSPLTQQFGEETFSYVQPQAMSPLRSKLLQSLRQPSSQRDAASPATAGGGGAAGVRMLRQAREAERAADVQKPEKLLLEQVKSDLKMLDSKLLGSANESPLNESAVSTAYEASSSPTALSPDTTWAASPLGVS